MYFLYLALELFCKILSIFSQPQGGELPTSGEKDSRPGDDFFFIQCIMIYRLYQSEDFSHLLFYRGGDFCFFFKVKGFIGTKIQDLLPWKLLSTHHLYLVLNYFSKKRKKYKSNILKSLSEIDFLFLVIWIFISTGVFIHSAFLGVHFFRTKYCLKIFLNIWFKRNWSLISKMYLFKYSWITYSK